MVQGPRSRRQGPIGADEESGSTDKKLDIRLVIWQFPNTIAYASVSVYTVNYQAIRFNVLPRSQILKSDYTISIYQVFPQEI